MALFTVVNGVWYSAGKFAIRVARSCCLKPLNSTPVSSGGVCAGKKRELELTKCAGAARNRTEEALLVSYSQAVERESENEQM